jgi:hypothetical protein
VSVVPVRFIFARAIHDLVKRKIEGSDSQRLLEAIRNKLKNPKSLPSEGNAAEGERKTEAQTDPYLRLTETLKAVLVNSKSLDEEMVLLNKWYEDGMNRVTGWLRGTPRLGFVCWPWLSLWP